MKNYNKKSFLYLGIGLVLLVFFFKSITVESENFFFVLLFLISPIAAIVFFVLSIINAIKWKKEKKKSTHNSNNNKASQNQPVQPAPQVQSNNAMSYTPVQHPQAEKPVQKKKPIEFRSFDLFEDSYKVYKVYSKVKVVGTQYVQLPSDIKYGESVTVKNEKENEFDSNAVALYVTRDKEKIKIGYLPKDSTLYKMANDFIGRGDLVDGKIDDENDLTVSLCYYKHKYNVNCYENITQKQKPLKVLTYTVPEDESMFYEGCEVSLMLEFGEIYAGPSNFKVSEAAAERLLECEEPLIGYVTSCEDLYDGKQKIQISIFEKIKD